MTSAFTFRAAASRCGAAGIGSNGIQINLRVVAAGRAVFASWRLKGAERHGQRVVNQQSADERFSDSEQQLDCLCRLDQSHHSGKHAEYTRFITTWREF